MSPVGIAVVGAGPWGLTLARTFASLEQQVRLRWICELDRERRDRAAAAHPRTRITDAVDDVVADPDVAAVVVAVEAARHHAVGMQALLARKHLFVEKPLALRAHDAEELCATAAARGLVLTVGHLLLHHPAIARAQQLLGEGVLGEPLYFESRRMTTGAPRRPGSAWWSLAPHDVSLAIHLFGAPPLTVTAAGGAWDEAGDDNVASAVLGFEDGKTAHIHVGRFADDKRREVLLAGTRATLTFDELHPERALRLSAPDRDAAVVACERRDALLAQCRHFAACVARNDRNGGNGAHAADVARVLEAGERSMRGGGAAQRLVVSDGRRASFEAA
jgi:predicted dehydrogenase